MSPLVAAPNRGYADWQRVENWDSGALFAANPVNTVVTVSSPVLDMSRYAYLGGAMSCTQNNILVSVNWFADVACTVIVGARQFVLASFINQSAILRIPNEGPFCLISFVALAGSPFSGNIVVIGTNRYHPLEFLPVEPTLVVEQTVNVGAGATVNVIPTDYYAGPVSLFVSATGASCLVNLVETGLTGAAAGVNVFNTNTGTNFNFLTPPGAWLYELHNPNGLTSTVTIATQQTMTGST